MEFKLFIDLTMDPENDVAMVKMFLNLVDTQWKNIYARTPTEWNNFKTGSRCIVTTLMS
jgi:hypothetical protein